MSENRDGGKHDVFNELKETQQNRNLSEKDEQKEITWRNGQMKPGYALATVSEEVGFLPKWRQASR